VNGIQGNNFTDAWANFTRDSQLSHATYSITILDNSTGSEMFLWNKEVGVAPASTLKTVTSAAALHYLGPNYQYETLLQYSGILNDHGVLDSYIHIVG
jgi:D-alanyl-D-alanine carboxypeptidase/D-alanyl-D-alanine-endopeptidase (penicillin-binding protein 4)